MKLNETCDACGLKATRALATTNADGKKTGYADPCIGILPGVKYGCCGHGDRYGYLFFENGVTIRYGYLSTVEKTTYSQHHAFNDATKTPKRNN